MQNHRGLYEGSGGTCKDARRDCVGVGHHHHHDHYQSLSFLLLVHHYHHHHHFLASSFGA